MAAAISLRDDFDGAALRRLGKLTKDAAQARRLLALAAIYDGGSRTDAARIGDVGLQTVRDWVLRLNARGPAGLIDGKAPGNASKLDDAQRQALAAIVERGPIPAIHEVVRWRLADLAQWIWEEFGHLAQRDHGGGRGGREGGAITRRWAKRGTRPRAPHDQRTKWAYVFGAICPKKGKGAGLVMPWCDTPAMAAHLVEISQAVDPGAHAVLILDQAGWHMSSRLAVPTTSPCCRCRLDRQS